MGESLSTLNLWEKDPKYNVVKDKLRNLDKDNRNLVDEFLMEQDKVQAERDRLKKQLDKLQILYSDLNEKMNKQGNDNLNNKPTMNEKGQSKLSMKIEQTTHQMDDLLDKQTKLKADIQRQQTMIQTLQNEREMVMKDNEKLRSDNRILLNEKENALSRLSKIAGIQLTKGNSDIADLSDVNRPTSLAEKYGSLYTDEWMEAYEEMGKIKRNDNHTCEKDLCNIVKSCYNICQSLERKQMTDIKTHAWDIACSLHQQPDQLVTAAKTTQYYVMNGAKIQEKGLKAATMAPKQQLNAAFDKTVLAIQKCMEELIEIVHERRKYDKQLMEYVKQEILKHFEQYIKPGSNERVMKYVRRCTELCWNMVIKNPPMILVCDQLEGKPVDKNMFSFYTKQGPIVDFVVWPALILQKEGPMIQKGVVQGKANSENQGRVEGLENFMQKKNATVNTTSGSGNTPATTQIDHFMTIETQTQLANNSITGSDTFIVKDGATEAQSVQCTKTGTQSDNNNRTGSQSGKNNITETENAKIVIDRTQGGNSNMAGTQVGNTTMAVTQSGKTNIAGSQSGKINIAETEDSKSNVAGTQIDKSINAEKQKGKTDMAATQNVNSIMAKSQTGNNTMTESQIGNSYSKETEENKSSTAGSQSGKSNSKGITDGKSTMVVTQSGQKTMHGNSNMSKTQSGNSNMTKTQSGNYTLAGSQIDKKNIIESQNGKSNSKETNDGKSTLTETQSVKSNMTGNQSCNSTCLETQIDNTNMFGTQSGNNAIAGTQIGNTNTTGSQGTKSNITEKKDSTSTSFESQSGKNSMSRTHAGKTCMTGSQTGSSFMSRTQTTNSYLTGTRHGKNTKPGFQSDKSNITETEDGKSTIAGTQSSKCNMTGTHSNNKNVE